MYHNPRRFRMNYKEILTLRDIERFEAFIPGSYDRNGCIIWKGAKNQFGRSVWWYNGIRVAARVIYSLHHGVDVPHRNENGERIVIAHTCFNLACVHVEHLDLMTHKESLQISRDEGRYENARQVGIQHHRAKLSDGAVKHIRKLYAKGGCTQTEIGELYGVKQHTVAAIINRLTWSHVE
jgi:DNA-binding XRE family transcriptional regulator